MKKVQVMVISLIIFMLTTISFADTNKVKPTKQYQTAITVTDSAVTILAADNSGRDVIIQNNDVVGIVYINLSGAATVAGSMFVLDPDGITAISFFNITNAVSVIGSISSNANVVLSVGR